MEIRINNIKKNYGKKAVLKDVSLTADFGMCVGIIGTNGSGKSTLFNILAGICWCDAGTFSCNGIDLLSNKKSRCEILGYVTQNPPLIDELSALDNLKLWYDRKSLKSELSDGVLKMLGIDEFINTRVSKMSGGMKKRLSIGCSVAHNPKILLLDEPTSALDLICKQKIYSYLEDFKKRGGTIFIATHDIHEIEFCDKAFILKNGFLTEYEYDGNAEKLIGRL